MPQENRKEYLEQYRVANADKRRAYNREWYLLNKEKKLAQNKKWKEENKDRVRELARNFRTSETHKAWRKRDDGAKRAREWRRKSPAWQESKIRNREKNRLAHIEYRKTDKYKEWYEANKKRLSIYMLKQYHHQKQHYRDYQYEKRPRKAAVMLKWELCGKICYICGLEVEQSAVVIEHVYPALRGGSNGIENLMPAHKNCNIRKGAKLNYPVARLDLIERVVHVQAAPRKQRKRSGK